MARHRIAALCLAALGVAAGAVMADSRPAVLARSAPVVLGGAPARVIFSEAGPRLAARFAQGARSRQIQLVALDMAARSQPGVSYRVYLGLPKGAPADDAYFVDTINFYNAVGLDGAPPRQLPRAAFDVTALARHLAEKDSSGANIAVTLIPDGVPLPGSDPKIGAVELIEE